MISTTGHEDLPGFGGILRAGDPGGLELLFFQQDVTWARSMGE